VKLTSSTVTFTDPNSLPSSPPSVCPGCGRCNDCGRPYAAPVAPLPSYPVYPWGPGYGQPIWMVDPLGPQTTWGSGQVNVAPFVGMVLS
jgi:hypothetical protein